MHLMNIGGGKTIKKEFEDAKIGYKTNAIKGKRKHLIKNQHILDIFSNRRALNGALNDSNDPGGRKRNSHAERYYKEVSMRDRKTIIQTISNNTGLSYDECKRAFNHLIVEKHDLEKGNITFEPDYDIAQSLQRLLSNNKKVLKHDVILIRHEALESYIMTSKKIDYNKAHEIANEKYNYGKALKEWKGGKQ